MRNYCTLFDTNYLPRGLALYRSLVKHSSEEFKLYILPMNLECHFILSDLNLPNVELVTGFHEQPLMKDASKNRTYQEYCWTCASNLCDFLMTSGSDEFGVNEITYLDSDMLFFADPKAIFDEIGGCSIAVIPHRLIPSKRHLEVNGMFNVSWVTFKNNFVGRDCCSMWAWQCRDRCSAMIGCGDQVYLDAWPSRYGDDLRIIQNIGAGTAPWNLANYRVTDGPKVDGQPVVFYHYHEFAEKDGVFRLTNYDLREEDRAFIYAPYLIAYFAAKAELEKLRRGKFYEGVEGLKRASEEIADFTKRLSQS